MRTARFTDRLYQGVSASRSRRCLPMCWWGVCLWVRGWVSASRFEGVSASGSRGVYHTPFITPLSPHPISQHPPFTTHPFRNTLPFHHAPPPPHGQTNTCENITLFQTSFVNCTNRRLSAGMWPLRMMHWTTLYYPPLYSVSAPAPSVYVGPQPSSLQGSRTPSVQGPRPPCRGPRPPAIDIWWSRLESCANLFTCGPHCTGLQ